MCHTGKSSWPYLRAPFDAPEDAPTCGLLLAKGDCGKKPMPEGLPRACWEDRSEAGFWKRHAWAWGIQCSVCMQDEEGEACSALPGAPTEAQRALLTKRLAAERPTFGKGTVIALTRNFYVVTDMHKDAKLITRHGKRRKMSAHEVAHLYAQRCEIAFSDFRHWFGDPIVTGKPMAVYVVASKRHAEVIGERTFGERGIHMNYAFAHNTRIADGLCGNGFVVSLEDEDSDHNMHGFARHQIGHILFSCWQRQDGFEEKCPRWAWVGAAHFLQKLEPRQGDYATFCYGETAGSQGPWRNWAQRIRTMSRKDRWLPIETFFAVNSLSDVRYADHIRAWSIMDLMLREDRERWLSLLGQLREGKEEPEAFRGALKEAPESFHSRWFARVRGKRDSLAPKPRETPQGPSTPLRERLSPEAKPDILAGRIRGLERLADIRTTEIVLGHLAHPSELVRETTHLLLTRTTDASVLTYLRDEGLDDGRTLVRAGVARALGALRDEASRFPLERLLSDSGWRVRANAAWALAKIGAYTSRRYLAEALAKERDERTWISLCDALAVFPGRVRETTAHVLARIDDRAWQVRLSAAQALVRIGSMEAVETLIERLGREDGRLRGEVYRALLAITQEDIDPSPDAWRAWWRKQKEQHGGKVPPLPKAPAGPDRYGRPPPEAPPDVPHHYGHKFFSRSVCFVLDTSASTELNMKIPAADAKRLGDLPTAGTRAEIARHALVHTLSKLDPRTRVRLVTFGSRVRLWKPGLVPATRGTVQQIRRYVASRTPRGETNFHGALKAALGLHDRSSLQVRLDQIPDTVFFITDGRPTRGAIQPIPELASWLEDLNRWAKIRLNVVALGLLNVDLDGLGRIAAAGDGEVIHVPEA